MCVLRRGEGPFGDAPDSANPPRSESAHARSAPGWSSPRLYPIPVERCPDRAAPGRGRGLWRPRPRRAQARGCLAAPRFRRAPPRPASRGLARPRCHVGLCGSRRRRCRRRQRSGGAASLAQPPECEDNDHPGRAGREPGASLLARGPRAPAVSSFPRPPRAGGAAGCCACDCRPAPLSPRVGPSARPPPEETALDAAPHRRHHELGPAASAESHQRGLPAAHPAGERVALLLPRQEMCGQWPGPPSPPSASRGGFGLGGLESRREKGAGAAGVPLRARPPDTPGPGAALALLPGCRPAGPGAASSSCWRTRECHLCRPAQKFKSGSAPLLQVQTLL